MPTRPARATRRPKRLTFDARSSALASRAHLLLTVIGIIACELVTLGVLGAYRHSLLAGRGTRLRQRQLEMVRAALTHASPEVVSRELERSHGHRPLNPGFGTGGSQRNPPPFGEPPSGSLGGPPPDGRPAFSGPPPGSPMGEGGTFGGPPRPINRMRLVQGIPDDATTVAPMDAALEQVVEALREEYGPKPCASPKDRSRPCGSAWGPRDGG